MESNTVIYLVMVDDDEFDDVVFQGAYRTVEQATEKVAALNAEYAKYEGSKYFAYYQPAVLK